MTAPGWELRIRRRWSGETQVLDAPDIPVGASLRLERTDDGCQVVPLVQAEMPWEWVDGRPQPIAVCPLWVDAPEEDR
jgi:hypothetical protein